MMARNLSALRGLHIGAKCTSEILQDLPTGRARRGGPLTRPFFSGSFAVTVRTRGGFQRGVDEFQHCIFPIVEFPSLVPFPKIGDGPVYAGRFVGVLVL